MKFSLSIAQPCSEKWENFSKTDHGGFCASCQKNVIDFTGMSDEQIVRYFANHEGKTCGKFSASQLKTYEAIHPVNVRPGLSLIKAGIVSLLLLLVSRQSFSQDDLSKPKTHITDSLGASHSPAKTEYHMFNGIVTSAEDDSVLPGVNVVRRGTVEGTVTDADGRFQLPVQEGDVLVFTFIGLVSKEVLVKEKDFSTTKVLMLCMDMDMTGEVMVGGVFDRKSRLSMMWSKVKALF